ncbi:DNA polymerase III, beta subunit [Ancylobacter novellus DSM 506]|uniref:Beta sliding clamp n=1 Tax=Ancylobacter novellus (strain ATCC 8093 / DSM 506 / JCM 20403 / CCM 1077 / IAM 12100 / NBRC 12443 / NCIMB 10456) TaxID=639283 RepID=D7A3Y1_ANCN5|nr:DNA polymerase III subunit beta [Ancylobacter novellus]ADH91758.1 DNA polymerase III, beta subunit [Ancylobacter novellus DSM 506]
MKLIAERTHLLAALKTVGHLAQKKNPIPLLRHVRLRTVGRLLFVAATDQDAYAEAEIPADVERQGSTTIDADVLQRMVNNFADGSQVYIDAGEALATIKAGRSRYQPPVLPADDFPAMFAPKEKDAARFTLMPEEVKRLLVVPRPAAPKGQADKQQLEGVYLHTSDDDRTLWAAATDGLTFIAADIPAPEGAAKLPKLVEPGEHGAGRPRGLMVPMDAVGHLIKLGENGLEIEADTNVLAARAGLPSSAVKVSYATRLIDNRFPPYERFLPPLEGVSILVEAGAFADAIKRLADMAGNEERPIAIEWEEEGDLSLWLDDHADGIYGTETIDIICRHGVGRFGARAGLILKVVEAGGRGQLEIWFSAERKAARLRNLDDQEMIAVAWLCELRRRPHHGAVFNEEEAA